MKNFNMNEVIKEKWADALESGEYNQTQGVLRDENGFCCLGVLCDLAVKEGIIPEPNLVSGALSTYYRYAGDSTFLPQEVKEWARYPKTLTLIGMNDRGNSFKTIAKYIREKL